MMHAFDTEVSTKQAARIMVGCILSIALLAGMAACEAQPATAKETDMPITHLYDVQIVSTVSEYEFAVTRTVRAGSPHEAVALAVAGEERDQLVPVGGREWEWEDCGGDVAVRIGHVLPHY